MIINDSSDNNVSIQLYIVIWLYKYIIILEVYTFASNSSSCVFCHRWVREWYNQNRFMEMISLPIAIDWYDTFVQKFGHASVNMCIYNSLMTPNSVYILGTAISIWCLHKQIAESFRYAPLRGRQDLAMVDFWTTIWQWAPRIVVVPLPIVCGFAPTKCMDQTVTLRCPMSRVGAPKCSEGNLIVAILGNRSGCTGLIKLYSRGIVCNHDRLFHVISKIQWFDIPFIAITMR